MANPLNLPMVTRSLRNLVSRPATRRYPTVVRPPFKGARGTLEFDLESCVLCGLCVRRCPTVALTCNRDERLFAIEQLRCIACGVCVDACNKHSLSLSPNRRPVHTRAEIGTDGRRPGYEEWHKPEPEPAPAAATAAASPGPTEPVPA
ncbi:MAG TPA: 4Fe-4S binding protein [Candidatus Limnocylindrales bacterium]|jgi:ech hydrogenase subunit F